MSITATGVSYKDKPYLNAYCMSREPQLECLEKGLQYLSGDAGRELLLAMHLAGVRLVVEGVWMKGLVEEITGNQPIDAPMGQSRKKESSHRPMFREQEK